ncbi:unnamed protein product [Polarella glacialis]|uniref:Uncharacterized protein n=1 Tax=Polarella glacialis TaxID=89957 RepID=A0A813EP10_POLGL|nr:unnamed protein product [Polarella glacialis]CAE8735438.1 unnamed protein product [Polarella glacialis]
MCDMCCLRTRDDLLPGWPERPSAGTNPPDAVEHNDLVVLRRFTTQYSDAGFDRFFGITCDSPPSADRHPLVCFVAKPEAYTVPAADACMKLATALLVNQNVGRFVAIWDLRELVMQPMEVMRILSGWMTAYAALVDWELVAASIVLTGGIRGYMTRAAVNTVMTVIPTTAKFNICFSLPEAMDFLDSLETSSSPGGPARETNEKLRPEVSSQDNSTGLTPAVKLLAATCGMTLALYCTKRSHVMMLRTMVMEFTEASLGEVELAVLAFLAVACMISWKPTKAAKGR